MTDNGNRIADCAVRPIEAPAAFARDLRAVPGVVDTGLFLGIADLVLVADASGHPGDEARSDERVIRFPSR